MYLHSVLVHISYSIYTSYVTKLYGIFVSDNIYAYYLGFMQDTSKDAQMSN